MKSDLFFMRQAMLQAFKALAINEVPIGAILVDQQGNIIARGYNQMEKKKTQLAHAELITLKKASAKFKDWRLSNMTLYVTVQPCMMCLGALYLSRISRVVYGVKSLKYGYSFDKLPNNAIYQNISMVTECMEYEEAKEVLQMFFRKKRSLRHV